MHLAICWKTRVSRTTDDIRRDVYSDNVTGDAENQQERLVRCGWVVGFVDGEGCFSIGFVRQAGGRGRRGYKTGWQVTHEFVVTQVARSASCLHELREFFGVGQVLENKRYDNHREHLHRYVVRRRVDLLETVISVLPAVPDADFEQQDFEKFARCVGLIAASRHLQADGLV